MRPNPENRPNKSQNFDRKPLEWKPEWTTEKGNVRAEIAGAVLESGEKVYSFLFGKIQRDGKLGRFYRDVQELENLKSLIDLTIKQSLKLNGDKQDK